MFTSIQRGVIEYMTTIRKMRDKLLFEREPARSKQKRDIAEGDAYKIIKEAWVAAISGTSFGAMPETTSTTISRVVAEIKSRKVE